MDRLGHPMGAPQEGIERHYPDRPRRTPLPKRHPDGRYSVEGGAERFGVSINQVRRWIDRGLPRAAHRGVCLTLEAAVPARPR